MWFGLVIVIATVAHVDVARRVSARERAVEARERACEKWERRLVVRDMRERSA